MTYIYHGVPEDMRMSTLIPLNQMLAVDPELRNKYLEKYKGREEILKYKIPLLECSWNDVIQFLPLHPKKVFDCQLKLDLITELPDYEYFKINLDTLDPKKTVVYFKTAPGEENVTIKWLKDVDLNELQEVPLATKKYYESLVGKGQPIFNYQFVPHILYKGGVNVSNSPHIGFSI